MRVREEPLPPVAAVISFIDAINRGDVDALTELMTNEHHLDVFDEEPLVGRDANVEAWRGYATAFPRYVIYPEHVVAQGDTVAVLGYTTGSHLVLPDDEERLLRLIWRAEVREGRPLLVAAHQGFPYGPRGAWIQRPKLTAWRGREPFQQSKASDLARSDRGVHVLASDSTRC